MRYSNPASTVRAPGSCRAGPGRSGPRRIAAGLAGVALAGGAAAELAPDVSLPARSERISVWGVPVEEGEQNAAETRRVLHAVAVERSRWNESGPARPHAGQQTAALAGAVGHGRAGIDVTDVSYRFGVGNARETIDVGLGAGSYHLRTDGDPLGPAGGGVPAPDGRRDIVVPTFSVGVRRSLSRQHRIDLYASGSASVASPAVGEFYTAKVKVEWLPTKDSRLGFEQSAVNMRFGSNSNFALRVRGRGPMLYYRTKF